MSSPPPPPAPGTLAVPVPILLASKPILAEYDDLVRRISAFAVQVADQVRSNPAAVSDLIHAITQPAKVLFQRWSLEIVYMLSLDHDLRFSQIRSFVRGISARSLSLKLDELEAAGLLARRVSDDKPPQVWYSLTPRGHLVSRLSFPLVLNLSMPAMEGQLRAAADRPPGPVPGSADGRTPLAP